MWILIDVYGNKVGCNSEYKNLNKAKDDLQAEFISFTEENNIEYGEHCLQAEDGISAWARLKGHYRIWTIIKVLP